ncbi:MAG: GNAT family N-acetyltransferase, partial [Chitinophagales bacterium]
AELLAIRFSVKENILSNPSLVTEEITIDFLTRRGKGWVCEIENSIVGFAIIDTQENNVWALFIRPGFERMGIGRKLQQIMLNWFFSRSDETLWLSTAPGTRAEKFYRASGWKETGRTNSGEIRFEMSGDDWKKKN